MDELEFKTPQEALNMYGSEVVRVRFYPPPPRLAPSSPPKCLESYTEFRYRLTAFYNPETQNYFWKYVKC